MKKILSLAIIGLLCLSTFSTLAPQVNTQSEEETSLVWSEEIQLTFGQGSDNWPSVVQDSDGTIWLVFISNRTGNKALYIKSSSDGGETWNGPEMLVEDDLSTIGVNIQRHSILIDSKGTMWITWHSQRTWAGGDAEIWYITSNDGGVTWSDPKKPYVGDSPWNGYYDPFITEAFGKIWIFFFHYSSGYNRIWCFSSDDEGNTWSSRTGVTSETNDRGHASAVLIGNELWLVYDSAFSSSPSWPEADIYLMKTTDGVSWSPEQQVTTVQDRKQFPSIVEDSEGRVYIFFGYISNPEVSIQYTCSVDEGTSWSSPEILTSGLSGYERSPGQTAAIINGKLWVAYTNNSKIRLKYAQTVRARILPVPYYSQGTTDWCLPTSMSMILKYYGQNVHSWDIAKDFGFARRQEWWWLAKMFIPTVRDYFNSHGLTTEYIFVDPLHSVGFDTVKSWIDRDMPVLLTMRSIHHVVVIVGYSIVGESEKLYINDPSGTLITHIDNSITHPYIAIELCWNDVSSHIDTFSYVMAVEGTPSPPKGTIDIADYSLSFFHADVLAVYSWLFGRDKGLGWKHSGDHPVGLDSEDQIQLALDIANHMKEDITYKLQVKFAGYSTLWVTVPVEDRDIGAILTDHIHLLDILEYGEYNFVLRLWDYEVTEKYDEVVFPSIKFAPTQIEAISWEYIFEDTIRGTVLKLSSDDEYFHFIAPDKAFSVKRDPDMMVLDLSWLMGIVINFADSEIILHARCGITASWSNCLAIAADVETRTIYILYVRA